jgi:hypothetical protein
MSSIGNRRGNTLTGAEVKRGMAKVRSSARAKGRQKRLAQHVFDDVQAPVLAWKRKR